MAEMKELIQKIFFWRILQGLGLTFRRMWQKPITMQYPDERWIPLERFRGQVALVRAPETPDKDLCVGCCLCVRVCPAKAITMETSMDEGNRKIIDEHYINVARCIFCGNCVEICPVKALISTDIYELATNDRSLLIRNKKTLLEMGHSYLERKKRESVRGVITSAQ